MDIEVLVAVMNQSDFFKVNEMNIQTNVFFANQSNKHSYTEQKFDGFIARMLTTPERGVGKNRNTALLYAKGDILLFADDDVVYKNNYPQLVLQAFMEIPQADMLVFNIDIDDEVRQQRHNTKIKRVKFYSAFNYGTPAIAIKKESVLKNNLWFSLLFGGGARYGSGEDTLFIADALKKKLKIYVYPISISSVKQEDSTWFKGYTEKYFFDKGALFFALSRTYAKFLCLQDVLRHRKLYKQKILKIYTIMLKGGKNFMNYNMI